ncbi:MAG: hypothetical protein LBD58_00835 [Treponema sp.]|nr:hypothetical protein [Treponema sp.]
MGGAFHEPAKGREGATATARFVGERRGFTGRNFRARECYASTAGRDGARIRMRILGREAEGKRLDQVDLFKDKRRRQPPLGGSKINRFERIAIQAPGFAGIT